MLISALQPQNKYIFCQVDFIKKKTWKPKTPGGILLFRLLMPVCPDQEPKCFKNKSRIRETKNLSTDADNRTYTILERLQDKFFFKRKKKKMLRMPDFPQKKIGLGVLGGTNERQGSDHVT